MPMSDPGDAVSRIVQELSKGSRESAEELLPLVYDELRSLARAAIGREGRPISLDATALVHEAWLRLVGHSDPGWDGRRHFLGAAAQAMRRILVEEARRRTSLRRGGGADRVDRPPEALASGRPEIPDLVALDEALKRLEDFDPRKARIFELRWFAGMGVDEVARVLEVSASTVEREWRFVRTWLSTELGDGSGNA